MFGIVFWFFYYYFWFVFFQQVLFLKKKTQNPKTINNNKLAELGLCVCVEPKSQSSRFPLFLSGVVFWFGFFFILFILTFLAGWFFWGSVETPNLCPLSRTERWLFVEFLFCIRSNGNNKIILG